MLIQILAITLTLALIASGITAIYTIPAYAKPKCITIHGHTFCFSPLPPIKCTLPRIPEVDPPFCPRGWSWSKKPCNIGVIIAKECYCVEHSSMQITVKDCHQRQCK